jgi:TatD DNase family protein
MIETHAHLYDEQFEQDVALAVERAKANGVEKVYMPNCDQHTIPQMMRLAAQYPDFCVPMMGIHPCYVKENFEAELAIVENWLAQYSFAAVGEIGLDYYWDETFVEQQKIAFERQIDLALLHDLPIVIHSRNATQDCIDMVRAKQNGKLKGIFHCFGDDFTIAQQIIDLGFLIGIGGVVTFKNSGLAEVVSKIDLAHLVLETDAPYLAPVPKRGKRNEPSYLTYISEKIAEVKGISQAEVIAATTKNAINLFK